MTIRRTEHPNFTDDQLLAHVRQTAKIADEAGLSDADRAALLPAIFDKATSKQIVMEEIPAFPHMAIPKGLG